MTILAISYQKNLFFGHCHTWLDKLPDYQTGSLFLHILHRYKSDKIPVSGRKSIWAWIRSKKKVEAQLTKSTQLKFRIKSKAILLLSTRRQTANILFSINSHQLDCVNLRRLVHNRQAHSPVHTSSCAVVIVIASSKAFTFTVVQVLIWSTTSKYEGLTLEWNLI